MYLKKFVKIGLKIKKSKFWALALFDPLYLGNGKSYVKSVGILPKDILIRNLKKKPHQNQTNNKHSIPKSMKLPILAHLGL